MKIGTPYRPLALFAWQRDDALSRKRPYLFFENVE
jgi:hypothetical protein